MCSKITKTKKYNKNIIAVFVSIVAFILGLFPFEKLVQNVYPLTGVLGIVLFACIFLKQISGRII